MKTFELETLLIAQNERPNHIASIDSRLFVIFVNFKLLYDCRNEEKRLFNFHMKFMICLSSVYEQSFKPKYISPIL